MEELTENHFEYMTLEMGKTIFSMLIDNMRKGVNTRKICGLSAEEIDKIFHVHTMPNGIPEMTVMVEYEIRKILENEPATPYGMHIHKKKIAAFILRAIHLLHNEDPKIQPRLWKMAYALSNKTKIKIPPYDLEMIKKAGFNPAIFVIYTALNQQFHEKNSRTFTLQSKDKDVKIYVEAMDMENELIGNPKRPVHPVEISVWFRYYAPKISRFYNDGHHYMSHVLNEITFDRDMVPHIIRTQIEGRRLLEVVESPYLVDAVITGYSDEDEAILLDNSDKRFEWTLLTDIITKEGYI
jgi:hypothetical protein